MMKKKQFKIIAANAAEHCKVILNNGINIDTNK